MKTKTLLCCGFLMGSLFPEISQAASPSVIQIDGKLDENAWKSAPVESGFTPLALREKGGNSTSANTSFRWFADQDAFYLAIECEEPRMAEMNVTQGKDSTMDVFQTGEVVEVFIDPKGKGTEYYQFIVNVGGGKHELYWIESGGTTGGEYGGIWDAAVSRGESGWTAEIRIPFTAMYRTSAAEFSPNWKFNIARNRDSKRKYGASSFTSWSPLRKKFHEPENFKMLSGLPAKDSALDIYLEGGGVKISSKDGDRYPATATLQIQNNGQPLENAKVEILTAGEPLGSRVMAFQKGKTTLEMDDIFLKKPGSGRLTFKITDQKGNLLHQRNLTFRADYKQFRMTFSEPFYRQCIFPGQNIPEAKAMVRVQLSPEELAEAKLEVSSESASGEGWKKDFAISGKGEAEISIPKEVIHEGENTYQLRVVKGDKVVATGQTSLRRLPWPENGQIVVIDRDLNLVINGKPTFFLGFMGTGFPPHASSLAQQREYGGRPSSRFMTPGAFDGWMFIQPDRVVATDAADFGKDIEPSKEMYAATLKRIEENKNNLDGLFYYLNDEPECRGVSPVYLGYLYRFIKKHDPYRPVLIVTRAPDLYTECADILAPHYYTDPNILPDGSRKMRPVQNVVDQVRMVREAGAGKIAPWFTPQAFSYGFLYPDAVEPTFDEFNCTIYAAVVAGAKGLIPFMYANALSATDLRLGYDFIYESLFMLEPYLLQPFPGLPVKVESEGDAVNALLQKHENNFALLTVNLLPTPAKASLQLPEEVAAKTWYGFRTDETVSATKGRLELAFAPYEVKVFTTDAKLSPTLKSEARFRQELDEARQELKVPGNQLFGRGREIAWSTSSIWPRESANAALYKLCDGETSGYAYRAGKPGEEVSITMGFPKEPLQFQKARLYGTEIARVKLSYWKKEKWVEAGEVEWKPTDPSAEIVLPDAVSSVKVRLDLVPHSKSERSELYEIQLF